MLNRKQKIKLIVAIGIVSYAVQFVMLRPSEPWWLAVVLGTISFVATLAAGWFIGWIAKP